MDFDSDHSLDFDELDQILQRLGYTESSAHFHGALCGNLTRTGPQALDVDALLAENITLADPLDEADRERLLLLGAQCQAAMLDEDHGFSPLLPDDGVALHHRIEALAGWCSGFLYGLSSRRPLHREALSADAREAVDDLSEFTRAGFDPRADTELEESAYAELVEYVRVAAQLLFYELQPQSPPSDAEPLTLH